MSENECKIVGVQGWIPGSWWRQPRQLRRLRGLANVSHGMYLEMSFADGGWFYSFNISAASLAWTCRVIGIRNPQEALELPLAADAVDPSASNTGKLSTRD